MTRPDSHIKGIWKDGKRDPGPEQKSYTEENNLNVDPILNYKSPK